MKVGTSLIDSAYANRIEPRTPVSKKKSETDGSNKAVENRDVSDTVDLSAGFSLETIQRFLKTEIGKKIDGMMADAGIDFSAAAGLDWSPEATSDRIFDMSTGLFGIWREQHPNMSEAELIDSFENVIRSSVDQGAQEAMALIGDAGFGEETQSVTEDTMTLLHEKLNTYFSDLRDRLEGDTV